MMGESRTVRAEIARLNEEITRLEEDIMKLGQAG